MPLKSTFTIHDYFPDLLHLSKNDDIHCVSYFLHVFHSAKVVHEILKITHNHQLTLKPLAFKLKIRRDKFNDFNVKSICKEPLKNEKLKINLRILIAMGKCS